MRGMLREPHPDPSSGIARPEPRAPSAPLETPRRGIRWRWCTSVCGCECERERKGGRTRDGHKAAWGNCYCTKFNNVRSLPEALYTGCRAGSTGLPMRVGIDPLLVVQGACFLSPWSRSSRRLPRQRSLGTAQRIPLAGVAPFSAFLPCSASFAPVHISAALH